MGYTHTYEYDARPETWHKVFPALALDSKAICDELTSRGLALRADITEGEIVVGGMDGPCLVLYADVVGSFNAERDYCREHKMTPWLYQHYWPDKVRQFRRTGWADDHTKTNREPADLAVTSTLLRLGLLYPEGTKVHSNGHWDHEWLNGAGDWGQGGAPADIGPRRLLAEMFDQPDLLTMPQPAWFT